MFWAAGRRLLGFVRRHRRPNHRFLRALAPPWLESKTLELLADRPVGRLEELAEALLRLPTHRDGLFQPLRLDPGPTAKAPARVAGLLDLIEDRRQLAAELPEPRDLLRELGRAGRERPPDVDPLGKGHLGPAQAPRAGFQGSAGSLQKVGRVGEEAPEIGEPFPQVGEGLPKFGGRFPDFGEEFPKIGEALPNFGERFPNFGEGFPNFGEVFPNLGGRSPEIREALPNFGEGFPNLREVFPDFGEVSPGCFRPPGRPARASGPRGRPHTTRRRA